LKVEGSGRPPFDRAGDGIARTQAQAISVAAA
jgi:hypothetical protein